MGANQWRVFFQVVLPQLVPSLISAGLFAFLMSFDEVVISWFITGPSTMTLPVKMYSSIKWEVSPVLAAVATILTFLSVLVCLLTYVMKQGAVKRERAIRIDAERAEVVADGPELAQAR
jgi:putative spermidine/putrescine transport system permease protein